MMVRMRTTLTLDPDVARELRAQMAASKISFKELVNERCDAAWRPSARVSQKMCFASPHSLGIKSGIDGNRLNQLVDELEVEELAARMHGVEFPRLRRR